MNLNLRCEDESSTGSEDYDESGRARMRARMRVLLGVRIIMRVGERESENISEGENVVSCKRLAIILRSVQSEATGAPFSAGGACHDVSSHNF